MIIDEAIERYTSNAEYERTHGNLQGCLDFKQLVEWLKDYKRLKEQEPCEDAISREEVLNGLASIAKAKAKSDAQKSLMGRVMFFTEQLPSVKPQEKTGYWEMPVQDDGMSDPIYYQVRCSKCGFDLDPQTWHMELHQYGADKFCPYCGAKMEVEE